MPKWVEKWKVESESGRKQFSVTLSIEGEWGCTCPTWKNRKQVCSHIRKKQSEVGDNPKNVRSEILRRLKAIS